MIWLGFQTAFRERLRFALTVGGVTSAVVLTVFLIGVYQGAVLGSLTWVEEIDADVWVGGRGNWNLLRTSGFVGRDVIESLETLRLPSRSSWPSCLPDRSTSAEHSFSSDSRRLLNSRSREGWWRGGRCPSPVRS